MKWIQLSVHTTTMGAEVISGLLMEIGACGTEIVDRYDVLSADKRDGMWDMIDEHVLQNMPEEVIVKAYFEADGNEAEKTSLAREKVQTLRGESLGFDLGSLKTETETVQDEDWKDNWKKWYRPMRIGSRIIVKPTWETYEAKPDDLVLEMDPGMAFGTGTHETTSMCIRMLEKYVRSHCKCIDVGCGSGILALAAAKLGAESCIAIDLDELAVKVADENIRNNHLEDRVRAVQGDLLEQCEENADVIVANIIADVICYLCKPVSTKLEKDGVFIMSGIIREKEEDVLNALERAGYVVCDRLTEGEWVCLAARVKE